MRYGSGNLFGYAWLTFTLTRLKGEPHCVQINFSATTTIVTLYSLVPLPPPRSRGETFGSPPCIFVTSSIAFRVSPACLLEVGRSEGLSEKWGTFYMPCEGCTYARASVPSSCLGVGRAPVVVGVLCVWGVSERARAVVFFKCCVSIIRSLSAEISIDSSIKGKSSH